MVRVRSGSPYSVVFADYEQGKLKNIDIVPVTVSESQTGKVTVNMQKETFSLDADDKVMLWSSMTDITPMCEKFKVK